MAKSETSGGRSNASDEQRPPLANETQQEKSPENFAAGTGEPPADPKKVAKMEPVEPEFTTKPPPREKTTTKPGESTNQRAPSDKRLTRAQMEQVIAEGGSVLHHDANAQGGARIISQKHHLPSELDLAGDDPVKRKAAIDAIDAQIEQLENTKKGIK